MVSCMSLRSAALVCFLVKTETDYDDKNRMIEKRERDCTVRPVVSRRKHSFCKKTAMVFCFCGNAIRIGPRLAK